MSLSDCYSDNCVILITYLLSYKSSWRLSSQKCINCRHNAYFLGAEMQAYPLLLEVFLWTIPPFFIGIEIAYLLKENT